LQQFAHAPIFPLILPASAPEKVAAFRCARGYANEQGQQPKHDRDAQREQQALEREHPGRGRRHRRSQPTRLSTLMPISLEIARIGWSLAFMQFMLFQIILSYIFILRLSLAGLGIAS
jgi:hypothetical protein